ncbi:MAG: SLC13 family permease, partial [Gemmatimonadetes bacterium]|nr:SLC13 family permease [Gemmatimonadota bacterium]NIR73801.1 SLC13 family permease [Candidatus Kutchimonas denitrificans]NIS03165.1 SLC13 family permease [Gemmatimonadota bacterium]NIT69066.1 SLC13 family permease [Gemmatimonadota bacterium]NIU54157.1 SLC13 family permease [Gemmatimonadota bacterium]
MGWDAWFTLAVLIVTVAALAREFLPPSAIILSAVIVLLVAGVVTPGQALIGFSNPAPVTVAALYILARAVEKTGALQPVVRSTLGAGKGARRSLTRLVGPAATASAFLNNTPIVAMLVPQVANWADRSGHSPSRYLMPLSFAAILGGMVTLIGTSTNLVISGLLEASGQPPLAMFEISPVGLPVALVGLLLIVLLTPLLVPERRPARRELEEEGREFVVHLEVVPEGPLDGQEVERGGLRHLQGVYLVEIERAGESIAPVTPTTVLAGGDRLTFVGTAELIVDLQSTRGLVSTEQEHVGEFDTSRHTFFEAVVGAASPLVGKTLKEVGFRGRYQAAVVAIHRAGHRVKAKLGSVRLRVGDTLLLLAGQDFRRQWRDRNDFLLVSRLGGAPPAATRKAGWVGLIGLAIVVGAGLGLLPILHLSLLGAAALVISGILTPGEARNAIDLDVILVIAGAFGLGSAMQSSGLADTGADLVIQAFGPFGPRGALLGIVLATIGLLTIITNNAAAVLMFPIAMSTAAGAGYDPRAFAIALAIAASASFMT